MPKFRKLRISYNPSESNYSKLTAELINALDNADIKPNFTATQARSFAESIEIIDQAKLSENSNKTVRNGKKLVEYKERQEEYLRDEYIKKMNSLGLPVELEKKSIITDSIENIYGKAVEYGKGNQEALVIEYQKKSNRDAKNFGSLVLIKNGERIVISNLSEEASLAFKKESNDLTMDDLISHLQVKYDVLISEKQENFMRSSWNQASLQGLPESMIIPSVKYDQDSELLRSDNDSRTQEFIFRDKQLDNIRMSQDIILYDNNTLDELKSAQLKLEVDVSNLREDVTRKGSDASTADLSEHSSDISNELQHMDAQGFLPRVGCEPRRVTVSFNSDNGLTCSIVPQVLDPLVKHTDFKGHMTSKNQIKKLALEAVSAIAIVRSNDRNKVDHEVVRDKVPFLAPVKKPIAR